MCSTCLKRSLSENLQFMFLFIGVHPEDSEPRSPVIFIYILGDADSLQITISCCKWLKTAIEGGNVWSTALKPKDNDVDETKGS